MSWKYVIPILAMGLGLAFGAFTQTYYYTTQYRLAVLLLPALYVASGLALLKGIRWGRDLPIVLAIATLALLLAAGADEAEGGALKPMSAMSGLITSTLGSDHLRVKAIVFSICALACAIFANRALPGGDDSSKWSLLLRWTRFPPDTLFVACILWGIAVTLISVFWAHFLRYALIEAWPWLLEKYIHSFKADYIDYGYLRLIGSSVVTWIVIAPLFYFSLLIFLGGFSLPPIVSSSILAGAILGATGTSAAVIIYIWETPGGIEWLGWVPILPELMGIQGYLAGGFAGGLVGCLLHFLRVRGHPVSQS